MTTTTQADVLEFTRPHPDVADTAQARAGDVQAFERIYRRHVERVHGLARRMMGPGDAEEATQDVFVRVWEKLSTFRGEASLGTWIHRVAVNVILARRRTAAVDRERYAPEDTAPPAFARTARPDLRIDFETSIATLPARAREVFVLHDIEGFRHEEIAELLGINAGTSKSQLHRARMLLRERLEA